MYVAEPLDACSQLTNKVDTDKNGTVAPFVLIVRGGCSFEEKVRRAQAAGFKAVIIFDNEYGDLVASNDLLFPCCFEFGVSNFVLYANLLHVVWPTLGLSFLTASLVSLLRLEIATIL